MAYQAPYAQEPPPLSALGAAALLFLTWAPAASAGHLHAHAGGALDAVDIGSSEPVISSPDLAGDGFETGDL